MKNASGNDSKSGSGHEKSASDENSFERRTHDRPVSNEEAQEALDRGDSEKIDRVLDELHVSTTESGKDQSGKPDTEGSNSSSKNLHEQND